jgi:serine/threonine protein kinase
MMQFMNLPLSSVLPNCNSSPSLSSSLLAETTPSDHSSSIPITSGRKFSARGQNPLSFQTKTNPNNASGGQILTGRSYHLTHRSNAAPTHRSIGEMDESWNNSSSYPNSSRSIPHSRRTPNRRRSSSNTNQLDEANTRALLSLNSTLQPNSLQSISHTGVIHHPSSQHEIIKPSLNKVHSMGAMSSGFNSIRSTPIVLNDQFDRIMNNNTPSFENMDLLLEIYTIVVMILMSSCMMGTNELDYNCCLHHPDMSSTDDISSINAHINRLTSRSMDTVETVHSRSHATLPGQFPPHLMPSSTAEKERDCHMNSVFLIREFMEITFPSQLTATSSSQQQPMNYSNLLLTCHHQNAVMNALTSFILYMNSFYDVIRLSKLLHPVYFHSKVSSYLVPVNKFEKQHSQEYYDAEMNKIGEGAFGTVYRLILTNKEENEKKFPSSPPPGTEGDQSQNGGVAKEEETEEVSRKSSKQKNQMNNNLSLHDNVEFNQYSHCFKCYQREHYPHYHDLHAVLSSPISGSSEYVFCQCWKSQFKRPHSPTASGANHKPPRNPHHSGQQPAVAAPPPAPKQNKKVFAIKKLIRERSIHDLSTLYSLYNEILCLEKLSECIGICGIEDYGLSSSSQEYIMILENGFMNILEWRQRYLLFKNNLFSFYTQERIPFPAGIHHPNKFFTSSDDFDSPKAAFPTVSPLKNNPSFSQNSYYDILQHFQQTSKSPLEYISEWDVLLFFYLYYEMILIIQYIHSQKIIHFDIKLANFILRDNPVHYFSYIAYMHSMNKPSGILFLTDFGEAIYDIQDLYVHSNDQNMKVLQKSRGTINIQSPEMLSISESQHSQQQKAIMKKKYQQQQAGSRTNSDNHVVVVSDNEDQVPHQPNVLQRKPQFLQKQEEIDEFSFSKPQIPLSHLSSGSSLTSGGGAASPPTGFKKYHFPLPDYSSDVWSLGCLFIELLTSEMLFQNQSFPELYTKLCLQFPLQSMDFLEIFTNFLQKNSDEIMSLSKPGQKDSAENMSSEKDDDNRRKDKSLEEQQQDEETDLSSKNSIPSQKKNHFIVFPKEELHALLSLTTQQVPNDRVSIQEMVSKMKEVIENYSRLTVIKIQNAERLHRVKKINDFYQSTMNFTAFTAVHNHNMTTNSLSMTRNSSFQQSPIIAAPSLNKIGSENQLSYASFFSGLNNNNNNNNNNNSSPIVEEDWEMGKVNGPEGGEGGGGLQKKKSFGIPRSRAASDSMANNQETNVYSIQFTPNCLRKLNKQMRQYYSTNINSHNISTASGSVLSPHSSSEIIHFSDSVFLVNEDLVSKLLSHIPKTTVLNQTSTSQHLTSATVSPSSHNHNNNNNSFGSVETLQKPQQNNNNNNNNNSNNNSKRFFSFPSRGSMSSLASNVGSPTVSPETKRKTSTEGLPKQMNNNNNNNNQGRLDRSNSNPLQNVLSSSSFSNVHNYQNPQQPMQDRDDFLKMNLKLNYENQYDSYLFVNKTKEGGLLASKNHNSSKNSLSSPRENEDNSITDENNLLLFPNYSYFKSNLLMEEIIQQQYLPLFHPLSYDQEDELDNTNHNHNNASNSNKTGLASPSSSASFVVPYSPTSSARNRSFSVGSNNFFLSNPASNNNNPRVCTTPNNYMENMVSLLLSDLLAHTRYYSKDYSFNLDRDETISFQNFYGNQNHAAEEKNNNANGCQLVQLLPILCIKFSYEVHFQEENRSQKESHTTASPRIECIKHLKHSNIFIYQITIPIVLSKQMNSMDEEEENDADVENNGEEKELHKRKNSGKTFPSTLYSLSISIPQIISVYKDFLLNYFIQILYNVPRNDDAKKPEEEPKIPKNHTLKPLVFIFGYDKNDETTLRKYFSYYYNNNSANQNKNYNNSSTASLEKVEEKEDYSEEKKNEEKEKEADEDEERKMNKQSFSSQPNEQELVIQRISFQLQQLNNSLRLALSGVLTRYLEEDYCVNELKENPSVQQCGDALQSILLSVITILRFIPNYEDSYCHIHFLETFLYYFFQSLTMNPASASSGSPPLVGLLDEGKNSSQQRQLEGKDESYASSNILLLSPDPSAGNMLSPYMKSPARLNSANLKSMLLENSSSQNLSGLGSSWNKSRNTITPIGEGDGKDNENNTNHLKLTNSNLPPAAVSSEWQSHSISRYVSNASDTKSGIRMMSPINFSLSFYSSNPGSPQGESKKTKRKAGGGGGGRDNGEGGISLQKKIFNKLWS